MCVKRIAEVEARIRKRFGKTKGRCGWWYKAVRRKDDGAITSCYEYDEGTRWVEGWNERKRKGRYHYLMPKEKGWAEIGICCFRKRVDAESWGRSHVTFELCARPGRLRVVRVLVREEDMLGAGRDWGTVVGVFDRVKFTSGGLVRARGEGQDHHEQEG